MKTKNQAMQSQIKMSNIEPLEEQKMNLDREYWVKKFLYPFACDTAPIKLSDYPIAGPTLGSV